jgi:hypothetical protein
MADQRVTIEGSYNPATGLTSSSVPVSGSLTTTPSGTQDVNVISPSPFHVTIDNAVLSTQTFLPVGSRIYQAALVDDPGVVAANNYLSLFNPIGSGKTLAPLGFVLDSHSTAATTAIASMTIFRTNAASAGTQYAANTITRFVPSDPDPVAEVRVLNPTVTTTGRVLIGIAPSIFPGGGGSNPAFITPSGGLPTIPAGTGIVFGTAGGDTDQRWNLQLTWIEF